MKTKKLLLLGIILPLLSEAQNYAYRDTHEENTLEYGVVEQNFIDSLTPIEKLKYNLTFTHSIKSTAIDPQLNVTKTIVMDTMSYQQPWMDLAQQFIYNANAVEMRRKDGTFLKSVAYTDEQHQSWEAKRNDIIQHGYHPGLVTFPMLADSLPGVYEKGSATIQVINANVHKIISNGITTTIDKQAYSILIEYTDQEGSMIKSTTIYNPYENGKGYLPALQKDERIVKSVKGFCITEVRLTTYENYTIDDSYKLIEKALQQVEKLSVSPNPNNGEFTATIQLANGSQIMEVSVVNILNGQSTKVNTVFGPSMQIDMTQLPSGQYALRVLTSKSVLTSQFLKN